MGDILLFGIGLNKILASVILYLAAALVITFFAGDSTKPFFKQFLVVLKQFLGAILFVLMFGLIYWFFIIVLWYLKQIEF